MTELMRTITEAFHAGGWGMWPILVIFLVAVTIAVERALSLARARGLDSHRFMQDLEARLRLGDLAAATQLCRQLDRPLTRIIGAGLARAEKGQPGVLEGMGEQALGELPRLERRTGYLALLGNVATLSGLFGTIVGLIKSFAGASKEGTAEQATLLAAGISEAMNCTAFGLLAGITALAAFSVLNGQTQRLLDQINHLSLTAFRHYRRAQLGPPAPRTLPRNPRPIEAPRPRLVERLGLSRARGSDKARRPLGASLQLTPMIDMFIVVLIFLLMCFSASAGSKAVSPQIKLPIASKVDELSSAPVVALSNPSSDPAGGVITLEGSEISTSREALQGGDEDWLIAKLAEQLEVYKHNWKLTHPNEQFMGTVILQADQRVDFKVLKRVIYSCGVAGYANIHFAVRRAARG